MAATNEVLHGALRYRIAGPQDDANLRAMLRTYDMDSWVAIALEREPSYFAAEGLFGADHSFICEDTALGHTVGMYGCSLLPCHVNGVPADAGYLRGLRVQAQYRNRLRILKQGYASIPVLLAGEGASSSADAYMRLPWFSSIALENTAARGLLERNLRGMPRYTPLGNLATCAFSVQRKRHTHLWERADKGDLAALAAFHNEAASAYQFSPVMSQAWLNQLPHHGLRVEDFLVHRRSGKIAACCALWNQTQYKQTIIKRYRFPLNVTRPLFNTYARLTGHMHLPPPGGALRNAFIAFFAVDPQCAELTAPLLREAGHIAHAARVDACLVGLSQAHPQLPSIRHMLRPRVYETCIEGVSWGGDAPCPLEARLVQPEIAVL